MNCCFRGWDFFCLGVFFDMASLFFLLNGKIVVFVSLDFFCVAMVSVFLSSYDQLCFFLFAWICSLSADSENIQANKKTQLTIGRKTR